jgi:hypothetical protein
MTVLLRSLRRVLQQMPLPESVPASSGLTEVAMVSWLRDSIECSSRAKAQEPLLQTACNMLQLHSNLIATLTGQLQQH